MQAKVPAVVATGVICLLVGGGLGAAVMSYSVGKPGQAQASPGGDENAKGPPDAKGGPPGKKDGGGKGGFGKGGFGKGKGGGGKGGRGPSPQGQLTQLVGKLDTLTHQTLHVELTPEQKTKIKEQLTGLDEKDALTDEEAKAKLDAILVILTGNRKTFEAAGFTWPEPAQAPPPRPAGTDPVPGGPPGRPPAAGGAEPGGPPPTPPQNPFKTGPNADHLKSVRGVLG